MPTGCDHSQPKESFYKKRLKWNRILEWRFTPRVDGKRISKNVYAKTREECEEKLAELIKTMKAEIAAEKKKSKQA